MGLEADIINVLRADKRCKSVRVGKVHFFHFWRHQPMMKMINVAWIKDNRSLQFAQAGYVDDYLVEAARYLQIDRERFGRCNAFIAPTQLFAEEVMKWYGAERPWIHFANYPWRVQAAATKRDEIVYVDYASTHFQRDFYVKLFALFDELYALTGCGGVLVAKTFYAEAKALPHRAHIRVLKPHEYDYRSKFGILVNVNNFRGAAESLPRKLLLYLHCGMWPLVHGTFAESIYFCRRRGVRPLIYYGPKDAAQLIGKAGRPRWKRDRFCIEERIGDLVKYLEGLGR